MECEQPTTYRREQNNMLLGNSLNYVKDASFTRGWNVWSVDRLVNLSLC